MMSCEVSKPIAATVPNRSFDNREELLLKVNVLLSKYDAEVPLI